MASTAKSGGGGGARRVLILSSAVLPHRREMIGGVAEYARARSGWELEHVADADELAWHWATHEVAGAVVEAQQVTERVLRRLPVPRVIVGHAPEGGDRGDPRVQVDDAALAGLACDHLLEGGARSLGHVGPSHAAFCAEREREMHARAAGAGVTADDFDAGRHPPLTVGGRRVLEGWLRDLPRPAGVTTVSPILGRLVVGAARHVGLAVPEDVAVVAVGEDELLCGLCVPALSGIDPNGPHLGWLAAELLDRLIAGERGVPAVTRAPPLDLVARRSSDALRIGHDGVREAARFIRERATDGVTAADVLAHALVPRRTLEVAFRRHLGRSIYGEITRVRVEHAKRLLRRGGAEAGSITDVALSSGFGGGGPFAEVFRRTVGESPRQYRARFRRT